MTMKDLYIANLQAEIKGLNIAIDTLWAKYNKMKKRKKRKSL